MAAVIVCAGLLAGSPVAHIQRELDLFWRVKGSLYVYAMAQALVQCRGTQEASISRGMVHPQLHRTGEL